MSLGFIKPYQENPFGHESPLKNEYAELTIPPEESNETCEIDDDDESDVASNAGFRVNNNNLDYASGA